MTTMTAVEAAPTMTTMLSMVQAELLLQGQLWHRAFC